MAKIILDERVYIENIIKSFDGEKYDKSLVDVSQSQLVYLLAKYLYEEEDWGSWVSIDGNEYFTPNIWNEKEKIDLETGEILIEKTFSSKLLSEKSVYLANKLDNILLKFDFDSYESYKMFDQLKKACSTVIRYDLRLKSFPNGVPLLSDELENIKKCETNREKKVLFACYIYARYRGKNGRIDDDIVKKKLFDMANVKGTKLELNKVIKGLREKGFINQDYINSNITIWVILGNGDEVFRVTDFNTLGNQLLVFLNSNYKICEFCKKRLIKRVKTHDRSSKYCSDKCRYAAKLRQNNEYYYEKQEN